MSKSPKLIFFEKVNEVLICTCILDWTCRMTKYLINENYLDKNSNKNLITH